MMVLSCLEVSSVETMYERIRGLRIQHGMSQEDLAKLVGYKGRSMIARIEAGEVNISETKIKAFAGVFGTTTEYLMNGTKPKNKPFDEILCMAYHEAPEAIQLAVRKLLELEGVE